MQTNKYPCMLCVPSQYSTVRIESKRSGIWCRGNLLRHVVFKDVSLLQPHYKPSYKRSQVSENRLTKTHHKSMTHYTLMALAFHCV